jgi:hypothetical protein
MDVRRSKSSVTASIGGILSLFLGFSFNGVIELVYHFTVRPLCSLLFMRTHPEGMNSSMAKHETHRTDQQFSPQASTTTSSLNKGRRNRAMEDSRGYRRPHIAHKSVYNIWICNFNNWNVWKYFYSKSLLASKQIAVPVWHIPVAVCTVLNSWWWTERPSETRRVLFQIK